MKKRYHILDFAKQQPISPNDLTRLLSKNAQLMLPLVELVEQCRGEAGFRQSSGAALPCSQAAQCRRATAYRRT